MFDAVELGESIGVPVSQRILVIDFAPRSLESVRALLAGAGHDVRTAGNGSEVDAALANLDYGFVVLEPVLPGRDGFELCRTIKESGSSPPLVLLASRIFKGSRFKKMSGACRADGYFERPNGDHELLAAVERLAPHAPICTRSASSSNDEELLIGIGPDDVNELSLDPNEDFAEPAVADVAAESQISLPEAPSGPVVPDAPPASAPVAAPPATATPAEPDDDTVLAALEAEDSLAGLSEISDNDIDAAWSRLVEPSADAASAADPPAAASPSPPNEAEELGGEVDRALSGFALGGPLEGTSWSDRPTELSPSSRSASETSSTVAGASVAAPSAPAAPADDPLDLPLDLEAASSGRLDDRPSPPSRHALQASAPEAAPAPPENAAVSPPAAGDDEPPVKSVSSAFSASGLEEVLDSALDGLLATGRESAAPAANASPEAANSAPQGRPDPPPREVPEGLRGMDSSTADLLSSLADLESSIPDGPKPTDASATELPSSAIDEIADIPMATANSSSSEDELTLEEIFTRVSEPVGDVAPQPASPAPASRAPAPPAAQPAAPAADPGSADLPQAPSADAPQEPPAIAPETSAEADEEEKDERKGKQSWRKWLLGSVSVAALLAVAVAALALFAVPDLGDRALPRLASAVGLDQLAPSAPASQRAEAETDPPALPPADEPAGVAAVDPPPPPIDEPADVRASASESHAEATPPRSQSRTASATQLAETRRPVPPPVERPAPAAASDTRQQPTRREAPSEAALERGRQPTDAARAPSPDEAAQVLRRSRGLEPSGGDADPTAERTTKPRELVEAARETEQAVRLVRLGDLDEPLRRLVTVPAQLTPEAEAAGVSDKAFVNVLVGPEGGVIDVKVMMDPGYGLGDAAVEAVEQWRYSSPRYEDRPVQVWKTEAVAFGRGTGSR